MQTAQTAAERASATLRRDAALADVAALSASVDLEAVRLEVRAAAAAARLASTFAERSAARTRLQAAEARLAPIIQAAMRGLEAARSALASDSADAATAAEREAAEAVRRRATEILQRVREFQTSAGAQIATARRLVAEATGSGSDGGSGSNGGESAELEAARQALSAAETAVGYATAAAAANTPAAKRRARDAIATARRALDAAVSGAQAAVGEARSSAALGAATRALTRARSYRTAQGAELDRLETSLSRLEALLPWYQDLERIPALPAVLNELVARGGAHPNERTNAVRIARTPRTIPTSATDDTPIANPDAFTSATFKDIMHATSKEVFSNRGDEFKVDGYLKVSGSGYSLNTSIHTGVKLTNDGLVIRTGGTSRFESDFTDMRKDITTWESDSNDDSLVNAADGIPGQNGWDLAIAFDEPQTVSVPGFTGISGPVSNWRGNNAFYWRSLVPADESQKSGGANYQADAFNQLAGQENLGTYEVWLSNSIGVNGGSEPAVPGSAWVVCPDGGTRWLSCPDDVHRYLSYAAYGLFVYTASTETFRGMGSNLGFNGQIGRINTLHFGYSAFANEDGQKTMDIGEAITGGQFHGYTLAYEVVGDQNLEFGANRSGIEAKLLRGDVILTVNIPKGSGAGSLQGTMDNFQRWDEENEVWSAYVDNFAVALNVGPIGESGTFSGTTQATPAAGFNVGGNLGFYKGSFYGPRADADELEIAGSWTVGSSLSNDGSKDIYGSFGAKQRPAAVPANN